MTQIPRRSFLTAVSFATLSVVAPTVAKEPSNTWDITCDVLVVGGGAAGVAAAVSAQEAGAGKVILLEKNASLFLNSTTYSNGLFSASGTQAQKAAGIKDPGPKVFAEEISKAGNYKNDQHLLKVFTENSGEAIDWLSSLGVAFKLVPNPSFGVLKMHHNGTESGARLIDVMIRRGKELGLEVMLKTKALSLITNKEGNEVIGVIAEKGNKKLSIRATKAVILTTGGFMGSPEMIDHYLIDFQGSLSCASPSSQGEGLKMAQKIGAATNLLDQGAVYCYGIPVNAAKRRGLIFRGNVAGVYGTIAVGDDANRFVPDEIGSATAGKKAAQKGYKHTYIIATEAQLKDFMEHDKSQVIGWDQKKFIDEIEKTRQFTRKADTIPELAKQLGLNPEALQKTINRYNQFVKNGKDLDFNRKCMKGTFEKGPFYGFITQPIAMANLGGLKVGPTMEIEDVYGKPIKHLYAAGEMIGGVHGNSYTGGNSIGSSITIGRVIGKMVAENK